MVTVMYKSYMEKVTLCWGRIFIRWSSSSVLLSSTTEKLPPLQNNNSTCRPSTKLEKILNVINCTGQYTNRLSMFVVKNKDRVALNVFILVISKKGRKKKKPKPSYSSLQHHFHFDTRKFPCYYKPTWNTEQWISKFFLDFVLGILYLS